MDNAYSSPTSDNNLNISDVIEVIQTTDPEFIDLSMYTGRSGNSAAAPPPSMYPSSSSSGQAQVTVLEQPASKALRFRYECEGRSAGSIPGVNSTPENKSFPTIQVRGYKGRAVVVVSCVTKDQPYRPHPHNLVGKEGCKKGVCTMEMNAETMTCAFSNLGIQCVKKKDIDDALRVREEIRVDPYRTGFSHRTQPTTIDLNAVRLCFQVFLEGPEPGKFKIPLAPVVSDPIYDKKAMSDLVICKLSHCTASVAGGQEVILLCEKVAKEDIQIRFYEEQDNGFVWEGFADFQPTHVHKQVAITFKTPKYQTLDVERGVKANIQLKRPSDGATSEPLPFEFLPLDSGRPFWSLKKLKSNYGIFSSILAANTALMTAPRPSVSNGTSGPSDPEQENISSETIVGVPIPIPEEPPVEPLKTEDIAPQQPMPDDHEYEYTEVGQWDKNTPKPDYSEDLLSQGETCRSLNDLLSQVAELEDIYPEPQPDPELTECLKQNAATVPATPMDVDDVYESGHYTSLQLAMKNPIIIDIDFEDTPAPPPPPPHAEILPTPPVVTNPPPPIQTVTQDPIQLLPVQAPPTLTPDTSNKRDAPVTDKLPPLPPKRFRKNIYDGVEERNYANIEDSPDLPPRAQPPVIETSPTKKPAKPSLFSKLFSRKGKSKKEGSMTKSESVPTNMSEMAPNDVMTSVPPSPTVDLTEAEHYALYTDVAPRASVSEFDEMSFYYSPVEGQMEKPLPPEPTQEKPEKRNSVSGKISGSIHSAVLRKRKRNDPNLVKLAKSEAEQRLGPIMGAGSMEYSQSGTSGGDHGMGLMTVKREPAEVQYQFSTIKSPMYQGSIGGSPSPQHHLVGLDYHPTPVEFQQVRLLTPMPNLAQSPALSPLPPQASPNPAVNLQRSSPYPFVPTTYAPLNQFTPNIPPDTSSVLDMDSQQYSFESALAQVNPVDLGQLNSGDLRQFNSELGNFLDPNNLSENLSSNLVLDTEPRGAGGGVAMGDSNRTEAENMSTDSLIRQITSLNNIYGGATVNQGGDE